MKVLKKGCVRKLAVKWDPPFYKRLAGGPWSLEKCQSQQGRVWNISQPRALKSQECGTSGVKLWLLSWRSNDVHVPLCFKAFVLTWARIKLKLNSTSISSHPASCPTVPPWPPHAKWAPPLRPTLPGRWRSGAYPSLRRPPSRRRRRRYGCTGRCCCQIYEKKKMWANFYCQSHSERLSIRSESIEVQSEIS